MRFIPTLLALWTASVYAQVPVTLKAGEKATAAEVMQNFKYLDSLNTQTQKDLGKVQGVVIGNQSELSALKSLLGAKADTSKVSGFVKNVDSNGFVVGYKSTNEGPKLEWKPGANSAWLGLHNTSSPWEGIWMELDPLRSGLSSSAISAYGGSGFWIGNPGYTHFGIAYESANGFWMGFRGRSQPLAIMTSQDGREAHFPSMVYADNGMKVQGALTTSGDVQVGGTLSVQAKQIAPDYVFAPDYPLMPLGELAKYVSENRHLPDVPDAKSIASQGVDVAQMNLVLLRKVEELTLHLIALQQQVDSLKSR